MDDATLSLQAAQAIAARLRAALAVYDADAVTLTRQEAALTLGLVVGLVELLEAEARK